MEQRCVAVLNGGEGSSEGENGSGWIPRKLLGWNATLPHSLPNLFMRVTEGQGHVVPLVGERRKHLG